MRARETGCTQPEAAAIAGFSERSGRRIEQGEHQPKYGQDRDWRTRRDPLAEVWDSELEPMLRREPRLEPTTLYEYLIGKYPGQYEQYLSIFFTCFQRKRCGRVWRKQPQILDPV
jgi:hypothetical protein